MVIQIFFNRVELLKTYTKWHSGWSFVTSQEVNGLNLVRRVLCTFGGGQIRVGNGV